MLKVIKSWLYFFCRISRSFVAFCNAAWSCKVIYGPIWIFMLIYGLLWSLVLYGLLWSFMAILLFHDRSWQNIDLIGLVLSFLEVIDPNL